MADFLAYHLSCCLHLEIDSSILLRYLLTMSKYYDILIRISILLNGRKYLTHKVAYLLRGQLCYPISFLSDSSIPSCTVGIVRRTFSSYINRSWVLLEGLYSLMRFTFYALHCAVLLSTAFSTVLRILSFLLHLKVLISFNFLYIWLAKVQKLFDICKSFHRFYPIIFT